VIDTTGAGDAFTAGFIWRLLQVPGVVGAMGGARLPQQTDGLGTSITLPCSCCAFSTCLLRTEDVSPLLRCFCPMLLLAGRVI
jgi:sugar/nucleoside kinase (ribokinase family)